MGIAWWWRCAGDFRFGEFVGIDIQDVNVVEVSVALGFAGVVVAAEDHDGGAGKGGSVTAARARTYALDYGISPLPAAKLELPLVKFGGLREL